MEVPLNTNQRKIFEEFLQELLLASKSDEAFESLIGMMLAFHGHDSPIRKGVNTGSEASEEVGSRRHLFKMHPHGVEWIGCVREGEKASAMLLGLATEKGAFYFVYDERSGKVLELPDAGQQENQFSG